MTVQIPNPDINVFLKRFAYIVSTDQVVDLDARPVDAAMSVTAFRNFTAGCYKLVEGPRGGEKKIKFSEVWMAEPNRITIIGPDYAPNEGRVFYDDTEVPRYNVFMWPQHADTVITHPNVEVFLEHLEYLIPDPDERKMFIQWLAHIVQFPGERPKIVPVIVAHEHGTGRGWITELMVKVLGLWNTGTTKLGLLAGEGGAGQYQNVLIKTLLATIHETKVKDKSWVIDDQIRDLLTEQHLQLNAKYGSFDVQRVYTRFLMFSNHDDAVRIPPEDRRVWVMRVEANPRDEDYYKRIYTWLEGDGPAQVFWHLKGIDLSGFNSGMRAPMTPAKQAMITETQTTVETDIRDSLQLLPNGVDVATWDQVKRLVKMARDRGILEDTGYHLSPKYDTALRKTLTDVAHTISTGAKDNKLRWHNKTVRVYALQNRSEWRGKCVPDTVRVHLDKLQALFDANDTALRSIV